jgi:SAM-dependent MidA family methyltransferase
LETLIRRKIETTGPLPFPAFMEEALYHPEMGYYARETRQVGRAGDFYTSVSVGPLFGKLLARRFLQWWENAESPEEWRVIETGAHDGTLAADILAELQSLSSAAFAALEYAIPEPLPRLQAAQRETLAAFPAVRFLNSPASLADEPLPGIAFGNEVLDALPFHLVEWRDGRWHECLVAMENDRFVWKSDEHPLAATLQLALGELGSAFPDGYRTEVRTCFPAFFQPLLAALSSGLLIWPDYGYEHDDYYHPDRTTGTLRTFSKHRAAEDPLATPGEIDITAHVDFTAATQAAESLGCRPLAFRTQSSWLTALAREWLLAQEGKPDPAGLRQFQTLTHPGHLGTRFHILELAWK